MLFHIISPIELKKLHIKLRLKLVNNLLIIYLIILLFNTISYKNLKKY